jgi:hypothetical protein
MSSTSSIFPWEISDEKALACIPKTGWLREYVEYRFRASDTPVWFHVGAVITATTSLMGFKKLQVESDVEGEFQNVLLHSWSTLVGASGGRKSAAIRPLERIYSSIHSGGMLASDGTPEAWHDRMAHPDCGGVVILMRDELATLFEQARRSYGTGIMSWLLETYKGRVSRETKSGGLVEVPEARLSILGAIPHDSLRQSAGRSVWDSGWMARMTIWAAQPQRRVRRPFDDLELEQVLTRALRILAFQNERTIIVPGEVANQISNWVDNKVLPLKDTVPDALYSCLVRLEEKAFVILAALTVLDQYNTLKTGGLNAIPDEPIVVPEHLVDFTVKIVTYLRRTLLKLYPLVGVLDDQGSREQQLLSKLRQHVDDQGGIGEQELADMLGWSRSMVCRTLQPFLLGEDPLIYRQSVPRKSRGRPKIALRFTEELG